MTNSTTLKSRKHEDVKGVGEKKLGDPFKTASENLMRPPTCKPQQWAWRSSPARTARDFKAKQHCT